MSDVDRLHAEWQRHHRVLSQDAHRAINARHYPGTRQLCVRCDQPTGRCEDDSIYADDGEGPLCEACGITVPPETQASVDALLADDEP